MHRIMVLYVLVIISMLLRVLLCWVVQAESCISLYHSTQQHAESECIDINKNYKVVYVCAFFGYWIIRENAQWKQYKTFRFILFKIFWAINV
jgi:hypothetical protein